jgi:hypothetical protein
MRPPDRHSARSRLRQADRRQAHRVGVPRVNTWDGWLDGDHSQSQARPIMVMPNTCRKPASANTLVVALNQQFSLATLLCGIR